MLIGATVGFLGLLHQFRVTEAPEERAFEASRTGDALARMCIKPIALDAPKHSPMLHLTLISNLTFILLTNASFLGILPRI
jgi:hypothetical protein